MINRALQNIILKSLSKTYPKEIDIIGKEIVESFKESEIVKNTFYLREHGLIDFKQSQTELGDHPITIDDIRFVVITHKGIDFIENDGGLSAILNTVNVQFKEDTLKALLSREVNNSEDIDNTQKQRIHEAIREMPAEVLKSLSEDLIRASINNSPAFIALLMSWLHIVQ